MSHVLYFAYGSNLLRERLLARCPGLACAGRATLDGHRLIFSKVHADGSGKCAFEPSPGEQVFGVLWHLPAVEVSDLDRIEGVGHGYLRTRVTVRPDGRQPLDAVTYHATHRDPRMRPYDWYLALVIAGARQHALPAGYVDALARVAFDVDPDPDREARRIALDALSRSGNDPSEHVGQALALQAMAIPALRQPVAPEPATAETDQP